ncbi:MAG: hypothetical protein ACRDTZ_05605 [Pseudonocardiaceae bacterium]
MTVLSAGMVAPALASGARVTSGSLTALSGAALTEPEIAGAAHLVRTPEGRTLLSLQIRGLRPGVTYGAHLHAAPCSAANPGGGHYKHDPTGAAQPPNELWGSSDPSDPMAGITANAAGNARGRGVAEWTAGVTAQAVVIHAGFDHGGSPAGGPKLACADLS